MKKRSETKAEAQAPQLDAINQPTLTPLVRRALNHQAVELINWDYEHCMAVLARGTRSIVFRDRGAIRSTRLPGRLSLKLFPR